MLFTDLASVGLTTSLGDLKAADILGIIFGMSIATIIAALALGIAPQEHQETP